MTALAAGAVPFKGFAGAQGRVLKVGAGADGLYEVFRDPANRYRPFVRWWWNGDKVTADELLRELDVLKAAGIGGMEINPIKFPDEADDLGIQSLRYLSDEWIEVLHATLKGAHDRGLICDMIVGSGWPYGGEFLTREEQTQMVALGTKDLTGGTREKLDVRTLLDSVHPDFVSSYGDALKELIDVRLVPAEMDGLEHVIPLSKEVIDFDVPPGPHVLYYLVKITGFMAVINGAPGAAGPVLNHYDEMAVQKYLDRISTKLTGRLGRLGDHFRAFFTDSIELEGANWCSDMPEQFHKRNGYDLMPWLPFVLFKVGEMGNAVKEAYGAKFSPALQERIQQVRYDLETTKRALFQERFIKTFAAWCTKHGVQSRMQAYGMDCDPIASGMMVDIPECETWIWTDGIDEFGTGDYRKGRNYTMINKFVSSSAHLSGKRLISCEEMTNTDDPFHGTMERIKLAGDQSMLSGVTGSILHGFNYSPPEAPFPGWVRYGSYFNERNPWWPYFKLWTDYKARLSAVFQQCDMQAGVAMLHPMADMASRFGFQRDPYPNVTYPTYVHKIWEAIHQNGHGCDYLSEEVLAQCTVRGGALVYGKRAYKALLLAEVETITPATAVMLRKFASGGGKIIFINKTPHLSAGLVDHERRSARIKKVIDGVLKEYPSRVGVTPIDEKDMVGWFGGLAAKYGLAPEVRISKPVDFVSSLHYTDGVNEVFFFVNYSGTKTNTFEAVFGAGDKEIWDWDAETGQRRKYDVKNKVTLTLGPAESKLIVLGSGEGDLKGSDAPQSGGVEVKGPWEVSLHHVNGTSRKVSMSALGAIDKDFSGTIVYRGVLPLDRAGGRVWVDLGHLRDVSELEVNGRKVGVRWYGEHLYEVTEAVVAGTNYVVITITTTLGNYMKTLKHNRAAHAWTSRSPYYPVGLGKITIWN